LRDEAVAATRCIKCSADYLLLDSKDYWFDAIQRGYPRASRCSCKNKSFRLRIDYDFRDNGDVRYVEVHSICCACGKARRQLDLEVGYCGTAHLFNAPLVPCKNPKILYDLKRLSLLITLSDIHSIVDYLADKAKCGFVCCVRRRDCWLNTQQDASGLNATIEKEKYLFAYAMPKQIDVLEDQVNTNEKETAFWKRSEIIRIGSKRHVCSLALRENLSTICYCSDLPTHPGYTEIGLAFEVDFSNEYVHGERTASKSEAFRNATASFVALLKEEFVCWRGPQCFDNPEVNLRIFGDRFLKKASSKRKC
jgi:hypothetical protein